jgi:hypothetical protein
VWTTHANGNYTGNMIPVVAGTSTALEGLESTFGQDLNGDRTIGIVDAAASDAFGSSAGILTLAGNPTSIEAAITLGYSGNSSGTLTASDAQTAPLALLGQQLAASFAGGSSGAESVVTNVPVSPQLVLVQPHI